MRDSAGVHLVGTTDEKRWLHRSAAFRLEKRTIARGASQFKGLSVFEAAAA